MTALALTLAALAAGADPAAAPESRGESAAGARHVLRKYCAACHGPGAPGDLHVLDHADLTRAGRPVRFVEPGGAAKSLVLQYLDDGSMPPLNAGRPDAAELALLKRWAADGAPAYPAEFSDDYAIKVAAADAARRTAADRRAGRYVSFAHLLADAPDGAPPRRLDTDRRQLEKVLAFAAGKTVALEPADAAGTVFRLDAAAAGWLAPDLFDEVTNNKAPAADFTPFDLVVLEYPYPARGVLRGDWLARALAGGKPLTNDLLKLGELAAAVAAKRAPPDGPPPLPAGALAPRQVPPGEPPPPADAWYAGDRPTPDIGKLRAAIRPLLSAPPGFDRGDPLALKVNEAFRVDAAGAGAARLKLLLVQADGSVRELPTPAPDPAADPPGQLGPPGGGGFTASDEARAAALVLLAAPDAAPSIRIVSSRHSADKITRFVLPDADRARVARAVVKYRVVP